MNARNRLLLILLCVAMAPAASTLASDTLPDISNDMSFWTTPTLLEGLPPEDPPPAAEAPEAAEGPCLPLLTFDGAGGHFVTMTAYLTNPHPGGKFLGNPSVGYIHVDLKHGKQLDSFQIAETLGGRLELGYAWNILDVGDLFEDIENFGFGRPSGHTVQLHSFNARYMFIKEGQFDLDFMPALTAGVHFKYNDDIRDIDKEASIPGFDRPFRQLGIKHAEGWEVTLVGSKMLMLMERPFIVSGGARYTDAAHLGLLGFTGHKKLLPEVGLCFMAADEIVIAAEFKRKYSNYTSVDDLAEPEDNYWTLDVGYLPTPNLSIAAGIGHFGELLNHEAVPIFGLAIKYEF